MLFAELLPKLFLESILFSFTLSIIIESSSLTGFFNVDNFFTQR